MPFSSFLEQALLNLILKDASPVTVAPVDVSLHTADPGDDGSHEVTGGGYARFSAALDTWTNAALGDSGSESSNIGAIEIPSMPSTVVTHFGLWYGSTWLGGDELVDEENNPDPVAFSAGVTARFAAGKLKVRLV